AQPASNASANITQDTLVDGEALTLVSLHPSVGRRLLWIALPACASLLLLATTNYVCQDVAVIPFLWVVPLSLYLVTFIICFDHPRWYRPMLLSGIALGLLILSAGAADDLIRLLAIPRTYILELAIYFSTMFFGCLVCHGQLVRLRPAPRFLTEYYLMISAGGALGGVFVGLIAPHIFRTHFEWTLALGASLIVVATVLAGGMGRWAAARSTRSAGKWLGYATLAASLAASTYWLATEASGSSDAIFRDRNFYGTVSVLDSRHDDPEMHHRTFVSGITRHGRQFIGPEKRRIPISYFAPHTGIGQTLTYFQNQPNARIGVVGMGVGVVATYARPGQYIRFYEINDQVNDIAHHYFTFLDDCECPYDVVLSDARLALERELAAGQSQNFDVLALDAFTGDAPPVHLLTDEAFGIYLKHLKPDGVIVVNITNRYINLAPVINAVAKKYGFGVTRVMTDYDDAKLLYRTDFMMLTRNQKFLATVPPVLIAEYLQPDYEVPLWTDKFSNLFSILKK
ncbi:MAG TPA: fused MFS/spermidine synthase, partial [Pirellulales bacterium]